MRPMDAATLRTNCAPCAAMSLRTLLKVRPSSDSERTMVSRMLAGLVNAATRICPTLLPMAMSACTTPFTNAMPNFTASATMFAICCPIWINASTNFFTMEAALAASQLKSFTRPLPSSLRAFNTVARELTTKFAAASSTSKTARPMASMPRIICLSTARPALSAPSTRLAMVLPAAINACTRSPTALIVQFTMSRTALAMAVTTSPTALTTASTTDLTALTMASATSVMASTIGASCGELGGGITVPLERMTLPACVSHAATSCIDVASCLPLTSRRKSLINTCP